MAAGRGRDNLENRVLYVGTRADWEMCKMCYERGCQYVGDKVDDWEGLSLV